MTGPAITPESSALASDELEVRLTVEQAQAIVVDVLTLRGATAAAPGQTPMLDRLVNTLVLQVEQMIGYRMKKALKWERKR